MWWKGHPARMCRCRDEGENPRWSMDTGDSSGKNVRTGVEEALWSLAKVLNGNGIAVVDLVGCGQGLWRMKVFWCV